MRSVRAIRDSANVGAHTMMNSMIIQFENAPSVRFPIFRSISHSNRLINKVLRNSDWEVLHVF